MKVAQIVAHRQPLAFGDMEEPKIGPTDAIVKTEVCGMCRSDWHTWNGDWGWVGFLPPLPIVPGHEIGGTVVEVGSDVERIRVGDRVTVPFTEGCGRCETCLVGRSELCHNLQAPGFTHNGGYAEYVGIPTFTGTLATPHAKYPELINGVANGRLRPADLVTKKIGLGDVNESMDALDRYDTLGMHVITF